MASPSNDAGSSFAGKRKREDVVLPIMAQTSIAAPAALWARGGTSNFAKTDPQNYHSKRRAEARQTVPAEEARRKVELLLLEEGKRVRRAGGVPFTAQGGLGSRPTSRAESVVGSPGGDAEEKVAGLRESDIGERLIPALEEHVDEQEQQAKEEQMDFSKTIVIQPGSRWLRMGRSTDPTPLEIHSCIYRKTPLFKLKSTVYEELPPIPTRMENKLANLLNEEPAPPEPTVSAEAAQEAPKDEKEGEGEDKVEATEETVSAEQLEANKEEERLDGLIKDLRDNLKHRMQAAKLKLPPGKYENYVATCNRYNGSTRPVQHKAYDDPYAVDWVEDWTPETLFPDEAFHVPEEAPYECRWPWKRRSLNTHDYRGTGPEVILSDIQAILENALRKLNPPVERGSYYQHSIALVIPDHSDKQYIEAIIKVLFQYMGFRQVGILQQAVCATFGAGLSSACIVDVGAQRSTVTCVDDGMMLAESRYVLNYGTDDVTTFYTELLKRISLPYKELDMSRRTDREMMDDLRIRTCIMLDQYVASNVWKFNSKNHKRPSIEYECQTFDQPVLAFSCFFDPRVMNWKVKDQVRRYPLKGYVDEYMTEMRDDDVTRSMSRATEHLLPPPLPPPEPVIEEVTTTNPETGEVTVTQVAVPQPIPPPPEPDFDVVQEAAKMPLEVAVACSLLAATPERVSNLAGSILILGGGGAVEGFGEALRWRVLSQLQQRAPGQSISPEILPAPRGLDPRLVTWRGGVVWTRLDSMQDVWIRRDEWDELGMRSWKMRVM
ncbi:hypothetical protein FFLO_03361 [Filobasidium floriforme]|uniref:Actin-related protein 8 n=1 Tax=Filobasidium floriforme TaxID=5210 RepID=A0A8K0NQC0_9TREE|nr:uncharacterized protein HD553DRAFT_283707 [Filobasidium floriforme]KAG7544248.1 hypothetical protein FFLO_03361 [Filobasidium floriforme]KAH8085727.1 hypothetical protein HD553DRAFT_283707 [Filobasidium floriforme]